MSWVPQSMVDGVGSVKPRKRKGKNGSVGIEFLAFYRTIVGRNLDKLKLTNNTNQLVRWVHQVWPICMQFIPTTGTCSFLSVKLPWQFRHLSICIPRTSWSTFAVTFFHWTISIWSRKSSAKISNLFLKPLKVSSTYFDWLGFVD